jgi:hypothetical protein
LGFEIIECHLVARTSTFGGIALTILDFRLPILDWQVTGWIGKSQEHRTKCTPSEFLVHRGFSRSAHDGSL